jgi:hypothetical protein
MESGKEKSYRGVKMNVHPIVMTEMIRQRQLDLLDDAHRWPRGLRLRRKGQHRQPSD